MPGWVFLRHGQSQANAEGWLSGHVDTALTELGRAQARESGVLCRAWDFVRVYSSDLIRARKTAELALEGRGLKVELSPALRERRLGQWAKKPLAEIRAEGQSHRLIDWHGKPPGGESMAELAARVMPFFAGLEEVDGTTLIVAHGGLIRVVLGLVDGLDYSEIGPLKIANCEPHYREIPHGGFAELLAAHESAFEAP
jgi:broad specificity phosphatase PhoE